MTVVTPLKLLKQTLSEWVDDRAPTFAASLAYYTVFSIAPVLVIALAVAGLIFGPDAARGEIELQLQSVIGKAAARTVQDAMLSASRPGKGFWPTLIGVVVLLFAATGVFAELQAALNAIWKVKPRTGNSLLLFFRTRLVSFAVVMGIGLLLLISVVVSASLTAVSSRMGTVVPEWDTVWDVVNLLVNLGAISTLFALMFKLLPDVRLEWRDVWVGAALSAVLFNAGKYFISVYLTQSAVESSYGAAGSLAALLVFVYYSSLIVLLGAELAQVWSKTRGSLRWRAPRMKPQPLGPKASAPLPTA